MVNFCSLTRLKFLALIVMALTLVVFYDTTSYFTQFQETEKVFCDRCSVDVFFFIRKSCNIFLKQQNRDWKISRNDQKLKSHRVLIVDLFFFSHVEFVAGENKRKYIWHSAQVKSNNKLIGFSHGNWRQKKQAHTCILTSSFVNVTRYQSIMYQCFARKNPCYSLYSQSDFTLIQSSKWYPHHVKYDDTFTFLIESHQCYFLPGGKMFPIELAFWTNTIISIIAFENDTHSKWGIKLTQPTWKTKRDYNYFFAFSTSESNSFSWAWNPF